MPRRRDLLVETPSSATPRPLAAFTIIEIALCLGIIAFALVAIIGALPTGLNVQKHNREQTIIGQDATFWMDALRSGGRGYDDLTNYVVAISNFYTFYSYNGKVSKYSPMYGQGGGTPVGSGFEWTTFNNYGDNTGSLGINFMTNGAEIIGLLSTPVWTPPFIPGAPASTDYQSNYIVAYVRAMSGAAVEKAPQASPTVLQEAFSYRMVVQNFPYAAVDTNGFCMNCPQTNAMITFDQWTARTNAAYSQWLLQTNAHDFRLLFRWPVLPNGQIPNYGRYTFRELVDGEMVQSNLPGSVIPSPLFYVQPYFYADMTNSRPLPQ